MSMKVMTVTFYQFIDMLKELDEMLDEEITIKAIGGFAMLSNVEVLNIDKNYSRISSRDIDTFNSDFSPKIDRLIIKIGIKYNLEDPYWLNNNWASMNMFKDKLINEAVWIEYDQVPFKHIKLFYLNLESLLKFKMRAIDNNIRMKRNVRNQDVEDVGTILYYFGESINNIVSNDILETMNRYPKAFEYLKQNAK